MAATKRARARNKRLERDYFSELARADPGEEHPLHALLHRNLGHRRREKRIARIARKIELRVPTRDWLVFSDERARLHADELQIAFNVGYQSGATAAHAEALSTPTPREARLARSIRARLMSASLPPERAAVMLLALALALLRTERHSRLSG